MDNCLIALRLYERLIERILLTCTVLWTCSPGNRKLRTKKYFICRVGGFWLCCTSLHIDRLRVHDLNALFFLESRINFKPQSRHWARSALPLPSRHRPTLPRLLLQSRESSTGQRLGSATAAAAVRSWLALQWSSEGTRSIFSLAGTFCTTTGAGRHPIGGKRFWFPKILTGWCCATLCASALQSDIPVVDGTMQSSPCKSPVGRAGLAGAAGTLLLSSIPTLHKLTLRSHFFCFFCSGCLHTGAGCGGCEERNRWSQPVPEGSAAGHGSTNQRLVISAAGQKVWHRENAACL